jgi:hypothetical protein
MSKANPYGAKAEAKAWAKALARSRTSKAQAIALQHRITSHFRNTIAPGLSLNPLLLLSLIPNPSRSWAHSKTLESQGVSTRHPPLLLMSMSSSGLHPCLWLTPLPAHGRATPSAHAMARLLISLGHAHSFVTSVTQAQEAILAYLTN